MVVRCTTKAIDLLGGRSLALAEPAPSDEDWYLNLLWVERRKCLLLAHAGTLFSVFRADVRAADLRPAGAYLVTAIQTELDRERLPLDTLGRLHPEDVVLARTASRNMLGFMNQMAIELRYCIARDGGLGPSDVHALNHQLQRTPRNRGEYVLPIDLVTERLLARG
jgi:hypothetical protein